MTAFNYADLFETIAAAQPDAAAVLQGDRVLSWRALDSRADGLARRLLAAGLGRQAKVAAYLYNAPEYLETYFAAFKAGLVPVNVNYRYGAEELYYLLDNADAEAIVFHASFSEILEPLRERLTKIRAYFAVPEPGAPAPEWAEPFEVARGEAADPRPVRPPWGRSGDDLLLLYTGGTTGMPKGVMWRQDELFRGLGQGANLLSGLGPVESLADLHERLSDPAAPRPVSLPASPLMHGTGQFGSLASLGAGGAIVLLPSRKFDAVELWSEVERRRVTRVGIVGPAFATPMLEALRAHPDRWDLSSLRVIGSSGAMWGRENKAELLRRLPGCVLTDSFASSEALGMGTSQATPDGASETATFVLGPNAALFTEDGRRVSPGSGERGLVAVGGRLPDGYYKEAEKTAKTFRVIEGRRWCVPGDWATLNLDGSLNLLGRGSACINTGGEKVFPEEVEEALKRHAAVRDAVVVGVPDERFGERICAVVELNAGAEAPDLPTLARHVKSDLADYKAPRALVVVASVGRAANGKIDYRSIRALALDQLKAQSADAT